MKIIDEQIDKQKSKFTKLKEGLNVSLTDSNISFSIDPTSCIEKGLFNLKNFIMNHFLEEKRIFLNQVISSKRKERKRRISMKNEPFLIQKANSRGNLEKMSRKSIPIAERLKQQSEKKILKLRSSDINITRLRQNENENQEEVKEIKEENSSFFDEETNSNDDDTFIKMNRIGDLEKKIDKSQLVEYDLFYKEQFFKNDVFKYDVNNIQDKEVQEINHEMNKLDVKRKLIAKKKEKDAQASKGLDTEEVTLEIEALEKEYIKAKTIEKPKLDLIMNNTEGLLYKGRLLGCYFNEKERPDFPKFALESEKERGAQAPSSQAKRRETV
jgi:hypothetical protein